MKLMFELQESAPAVYRIPEPTFFQLLHVIAPTTWGNAMVNGGFRENHVKVYVDTDHELMWELNMLFHFEGSMQRL